MTTWQVFALLVGWLGSWAVLQWTMTDARASRSVTTAHQVAVAVPRLVSWGCGLALAVGGLWRLAAAVAR